MSEAEQSNLTEFADDGPESDDPPTSADNARDIEHLADVVESLTEQVGTLATELGHDPAEYRAEDIDSDPHGMYQ